MKKITLLLAFFALILTSCSDDEKTPATFPVTNTGTLTIDGQTVAVGKAYLIKPYTGSNPDYDKRRFYVALTNGTITVANGELVYGNDITQMADFNLYTSVSGAGSVQNAAYPLYIPDSGFDTQDAFTDFAGFGKNLVVQDNQPVSGEMLDSDDLGNGQVQILQANGLYTISFNFNGNGHQISGQYSGTVNELEYVYE